MIRFIAHVVLWSQLLITQANAQSISPENILIKQQGDYWQVTPKYNITLSEAIVEAIHNGIEITFVSEVRLLAEKNWWPDKMLSKTEKRFEIHYFSLSSQYQLKQPDTEKPAAFTTLDSLLIQLTQNTRFSIKKQPQATTVESRFYLDQRALPSTMQLPILWDKEWSLQAQPSRQPLPVTD
ncbi:DUF4390 domain-containing protein [Marinicella gelatinilytica]|uniref:DUF4390 domain-containing protein n=1 Tax=Marinicella gelatinilytica TaxID=2996017 RepID=UPI002260D31E|nr:DUF4390 domain-containing protein [Marinicella gelatinilytica]MCX7544542.1 DUF4390 domain-containing protein [Marinicella gelatinilytica]